MNGFLKRIILSSTAVILAFSLLVSSYGTTQVKAAALPVVYTSWELWVSLLSLLGICAAAENLDNVDQAVEDIKSSFKIVYQQNNGGTEPSDEELAYFTDLHQYFDSSNNTLRIPEAAWDMYKVWGDAITAKSVYKPIENSISLSSATAYEDFHEWLVSYLNLEEYSTVSSVKNFTSYCYDALVDTNFTGVIFQDFSYSDSSYGHIILGKMYSNRTYGWVEKVSGVYSVFSFSSNSSGIVEGGPHLILKQDGTPYSCNKNDTAYDFSSKFDCVALLVNGSFYDFYSTFNYPIDTTTSCDWGNKLALSDFAVPFHTISDAFSSVTQSVANNLSIADVFDAGTYEILTSGRTYNPDTEEVTGDVVVSLPAPETIQQYSEGTITWQQMLEILNAQAIDTSTAMDLNSQEFINTQKGIANNVANIWNFLQSLLQGLFDMFLSLFIPSDGFFESKFDELMDMFDGLGVEAYDISNLFDPDEGEPNNPFQDITIVVFDQEVVIVSFQQLPMFLDEFRPVIRGLLMLFLVYYCINQFLSLVRLAGMYDGSNQNSLPGTAIKPADKGGL